MKKNIVLVFIIVITTITSAQTKVDTTAILSLDKISSFFIRTNGKIHVFVMEPENGNLPNNFDIFDFSHYLYIFD